MWCKLDRQAQYLHIRRKLIINPIFNSVNVHAMCHLHKIILKLGTAVHAAQIGLQRLGG